MLREVGSKDGDEEKNITVVCGKDKKDDEEEKEPSLSTRLAERFVALVTSTSSSSFCCACVLWESPSPAFMFFCCSRSTLIHSSPEQHCAPQPSCAVVHYRNRRVCMC